MVRLRAGARPTVPMPVDDSSAGRHAGTCLETRVERGGEGWRSFADHTGSVHWLAECVGPARRCWDSGREVLVFGGEVGCADALHMHSFSEGVCSSVQQRRRARSRSAVHWLPARRPATTTGRHDGLQACSRRAPGSLRRARGEHRGPRAAGCHTVYTSASQTRRNLNPQATVGPRSHRQSGAPRARGKRRRARIFGRFMWYPDGERVPGDGSTALLVSARIEACAAS